MSDTVPYREWKYCRRCRLRVHPTATGGYRHAGGRWIKGCGQKPDVMTHNEVVQEREERIFGPRTPNPR